MAMYLTFDGNDTVTHLVAFHNTVVIIEPVKV